MRPKGRSWTTSSPWSRPSTAGRSGRRPGVPSSARGELPSSRLEKDRPGDIAILAGRNDRKMALVRRLHDAGFHVLADKPWLAGPDGLDDVRSVLAGGAVAMEIMTGRHEITSVLTRMLVGDAEVFGVLEDAGVGAPAIRMTSVHHLDKVVNGAPLRRPAWFFDVRVQGDGIADIPTHMVDHAQQLAAAARRSPEGEAVIELIAARRWATGVPKTLFARVTGLPDFPPELRDVVVGPEFAYAGNAELSFRLGEVTVTLDTRWDLSAPAGGGDTHRAVFRGTRAEIRVEQDASTGFRRRLSVSPRSDGAQVRAAVERAVAGWQGAWPGVAVAEGGGALEILVPRTLDTGHESHFPLVLAEFLTFVDQGRTPAARAADTLAKYALLARASAEARRAPVTTPGV